MYMHICFLYAYLCICICFYRFGGGAPDTLPRGRRRENGDFPAGGKYTNPKIVANVIVGVKNISKCNRPTPPPGAASGKW